MFGLDPQPAGCSASARPQPISGSGQRPLLSDGDLRSQHFFPRLLGVPSVGEEHTFGLGDKQSASATRESTQVSNIGKMRNQQCIETMLVEKSP